MPSRRSTAWLSIPCVGLACALATTAAHAADAIVPGDLLVERPTLHCVGVRWYLGGDANRNATGTLAYRAEGQPAWREAHPLLRMGGEHIARGAEDIEWTTPHMLAGSVVGLEPDTPYELKITLTDPDGAGTTLERIVTSHTRAEPRAASDGRTLHVYPPTHAGPREAPSYTGLRDAYDAAGQGDTLLLHAGVYTIAEPDKTDRTDYVMAKDGTAERPIVIRGAGDGEAILDGDGALRLINCRQADYHIFEDLTLRDADHLIDAGRDAQGAIGLAVRQCRFEDSAFPIIAVSPHSRDFYIADSVFTGPNQVWQPRDESAEKFGASHAIWLSGQGHVVCHNRITGYWDGIDLFGRNPPEDRALQNCAIDFYGNDLAGFADDAIEMDYGVHNIRVWGNRIHNTFMGISMQPVYGGPGYVFRNLVYNCTRAPIKPNQWPAGLMIFHNTFVAAGSAGRWAPIWQNSRIHNNLFLGADGAEGVIWTGSPTLATSRMDYNGWRFHQSTTQYPIWWKFPEPRPVWSGGSLATECTYRDLAHFAADTGFEAHGVVVDYDIFAHCPPPSGAMEPLPADLDLRLRQGAAAIDRGLPLPGFNDAFTGAGPDLGALERGVEPATYGPR